MRISWYIPAFIAIGIAWLAGMFLDIMEVDAAQYASMSQWMAGSGDYIHLFDLNQPYLDKPPLIFWTTATSFKLLGVSNFAYRLPSVLFGLLAIVSTYRLTALFYARKTALMAALILAASQCFFVMNQDVKTDMFLIGAVMFSIWQLMLHLESGKWMPLFLGFFGLGLGMLAKGPLGVMIPALAIGFDQIIRRNRGGILNWKWLVGIPVFGLVVLPFCIGLYDQFGWEGIEFFFWTQSFGRVTGDSSWANDAGPFFLVQTFAWAFLPWTILLIPALFRAVKELVVARFRLGTSPEAFAIGGFFLTFLGLSLSRFKLPHYIFVVTPFAAIMVAAWIFHISQHATNSRKVVAWGRFQFGLTILLILALTGLIFWAFSGISIWVGLVALVMLTGVFGSFQLTATRMNRLVIPAAIGIATINFVLNAHIMPRIIQYQCTATVGKQIRSGKYPHDQFYTFLAHGRALDHYGGKVFPSFPSLVQLEEKLMEEEEMYVFTRQLGMDEIADRFPRHQVLDTLAYFPSGRLNLKFINPTTREEAAKPRYIVRIRK